MVTISNLKKMISQLVVELFSNGIEPTKVILFGSYAKGCVKQNSDIDIAVWSPNFTGQRLLDIERIAPMISKFQDLELHTFSLEDTKFNNPFIEEIENTGIDYSEMVLPFIHDSDKVAR